MKTDIRNGDENEQRNEKHSQPLLLEPQKIRFIFPDFYLIGEDKKTGNIYEVHSQLFNVIVIGVVSMIFTLLVVLLALIGAVGIVFVIDMLLSWIVSIL